MAERILQRALVCLCLVMGTIAAHAREAEPVATNPQIEARMMALASELRCLVCQNQTIADSHAELAVDLRMQVREMLEQGKDEGQILEYMTERYGDFVLYRPPFKAITAVLWIGPPALLLLAVGLLFVVLRRRQRLSAEAFDPDTDTDTDTETSTNELENASHVPNQ